MHLKTVYFKIFNTRDISEKNLYFYLSTFINNGRLHIGSTNRMLPFQTDRFLLTYYIIKKPYMPNNFKKRLNQCFSNCRS